MATKLKKSKKIRAFCYRLFAVGAFFTMAASGIMGREALSALFAQGPELFYGRFYYLPEYKTYMENLYNQALAGYGGIYGADDDLMFDADTEKSAQQKREELYKKIDSEGGSIVYAVRQTGKGTGSGNISFPVLAESDGHLLLPENIRLCYFWDGPGSLEHDYVRGITRNTPASTEHRVLENGEWFSLNPKNLQQIRLIIAVRTDRISGTLAGFQRTAESYQAVLCIFFASLLLTVLFWLLSLFSRKTAAEAKYCYSIFSGKIWLECKLALIALTCYLFFCYRNDLFSPGLSAQPFAYKALWIFFPAGCLLSLVWLDLKYNAEKVFYNSLPVKLFRYLQGYVHASPWYRRAMAIHTFTLLCSLFSLTAGILLLILEKWSHVTILGQILSRVNIRTFLHVLGIVLIISGCLAFLMALRLRCFIRDAKAVAARLSEMQDGVCSTPLLLPAHSLLEDAAADLNRLESGIEKAVEAQNRSNKLRVELLTNVSHDLKTPLTSIINYADLLCEEELPQTSADYASALRDKAYRLKNMVQDVFDLSKAASGNMPVEKHLLDFVKLIRQTLADMDERIRTSSLTFKVTASAEPLMIEADGEKLYRIFQNLFVNALQYSLENSRVHIQISSENGYACAKIKNTSKWELDFDTQDIMERFVRADASRTTEGSGLGLSIAQSFTETCGGAFTIETDADMFIACVRFPLAQAAETETE